MGKPSIPCPYCRGCGAWWSPECGLNPCETCNTTGKISKRHMAELEALWAAYAEAEGPSTPTYEQSKQEQACE